LKNEFIYSLFHNNVLMKNILCTFIIGFYFFTIVSCSETSKPIRWGVASGLAGAGTGALIGSLIKNGDIPLSAAFGASVGVPLGIVAGALYLRYLSPAGPIDRTREIKLNQELIFQNERDIQRLRDKIREEGPGDADKSMREYIYTGPTRGNYYR
jgi:hypothetical protein